MSKYVTSGPTSRTEHSASVGAPPGRGVTEEYDEHNNRVPVGSSEAMEVLVLRRDLLLSLATRDWDTTGKVDHAFAKAGAMCEVKRRELVAGTWDCKPQEYRDAVDSYMVNGWRCITPSVGTPLRDGATGDAVRTEGGDSPCLGRTL